jgi:hydroxymethylbilane synthase
VPIAGYAELTAVPGAPGARQLRLRAYVGSLDGADALRGEKTGPAEAPEALGTALADELLERGAGRILAEVRGR